MAAYNVLVIGEPGPLWDGLHALLMTIPHVETVTLIHDLPAAFDKLVDPYPVLVLADCLRSGDRRAALAQIHARWPQTPCIILVNDSQQQYITDYAGADAVLFEGMPAAKLVAAIEKVMSARETSVHDWIPNSREYL